MSDHPLSDRITPHLEAGEVLVWSQIAPRWRLFVPELVPLAFSTIVGVIGAGFGLIGLAAEFAWVSGISGTGAWVFVAFGAGIAALAAWLLNATLGNMRAAAHTLYAVTDRAGLIIVDAPRARIRRFDARKIAERRWMGDRVSFDPDDDEEPFRPDATFLGVCDIPAAEAALAAICGD